MLISTIINGTLLNFDKRYEDDLRVIFDQWPKLHLGLDALSNQKILNGVYQSPTLDQSISEYLLFQDWLEKTNADNDEKIGWE